MLQLSRSELEKKIERMEKERRDLDRTKPRSPEEEAERHEKSKAAAAAHKRAKHQELAQRVEALIATARAALGIFDVLDADKSGTLSKDEIVAGAKQINLTPEEAEPAERVLRSLKISLIFYNHNYNHHLHSPSTAHRPF